MEIGNPRRTFFSPTSVRGAGRVRTRGPAVATYAVRSVFRNRRTTASALAGLVLGVAVATAPWVSLDSSVGGLVDYYLEGLFVDAMAMGPRENLDAALVAIRSVPDTRRVEALETWWGDVNGTASGNPDIDGLVELDFVRDSYASVLEGFGLSWDAPPAPGTVIVDERLREQGLALSDRVVMEQRVAIYENGTWIRDEVRTTNFTVGGFYRTTRSSPFTGSGFMLAAAADADGFAAALNLTWYRMPGRLLIWLDREALLDPFDVAESERRLRRQLSRMEEALLPFEFVPSYGLSRGLTLLEIPATIGNATFPLRVLFLGLAVPTLLIAALLAKVGFEVGLASRRRELAVLRARGLSSRGVRLFLLVEVAVVGLIGAALGLVVSVGMSRLFSPGVFLAQGPVAMDVAVSSGTAILAVLLGLLLALAVARTPARHVASEDLVSSMKAFHVEEASIDYRPSRDFLVSGIGAAGLILLLAWGSVGDAPLGIVTFLFGASTALLAPFAPFFLIAGVARYLTRGTNRAYRALARMFRPLLGELDALVDRNLVRAPRRSSNTAMIVTFVVGFVLVMSVLVASSSAYQEEQILWSTPSDLVADVSDEGPGAFNVSTMARLRAIPGVAVASPVIWEFSTRGSVILFDPPSYRQTVPWLRAYHIGGVSPDALLDALARGFSFAANSYFRELNGLEPGDMLTFGDILGDSASLRLEAYVPRLPGLYGFALQDMEDLAYLSLASLPDANLSRASSGRYLVALAPDANAIAVADAVSEVLGGRAYIRLQADARRAAAADPVSTTVLNFLQTQAYLSVVVLIVAVGLLVYSASVDRRDEMVTLIARGIDTRVATRLLMAEGWIVSLLGLVLGIVAGLVTAATFLGLASAFAPTPIPLAVPVSAVIPLFAVLVGVWVAGFAGAISVRRLDVPRLLKLRGG